MPLQRLSHITSDLQEGVMKTRMQPIGNAWNKLPRLVRDLARDMDKRIELVMHGADTELDRQVLELIKDPLTHMVRNCADHGLETPAERRAAGKPETGRITLNAFHEGGHIIIEMADDGRGLPVDRIRAKALASGLATEAELAAMTDEQIQPLHLPGRLLHRRRGHRRVGPRRRHGRGEDQYRTHRRHHRPQERGRPGHHLHRQDPADARHRLGADRARPAASASPFRRSAWWNWCARGGGDRAAAADRTESADRTDQRHAGAAPARPAAAAGQPGRTAAPGRDDDGGDGGRCIVVTQVGASMLGIIVDRVFDTEEIVVKPVAPILRHITMFSGNTILGDGSVIMILDPNGIARANGVGAGSESRCREHAPRGDAPQSDRRTAMLLFRAGGSAAQGGAARPGRPAGGHRARQDRDVLPASRSRSTAAG